MASAGGYVYAIGAEGTPLVKIGYAKHVDKRLKMLQTGQPFSLRVLAFVSVEENAHRIEKQIHDFLTEERKRGEWFEVSIDESRLTALVSRAIQSIADEERKKQERLFSRPCQPLGKDELPIFRERLLIARRRKAFSQGALAKQTGMHPTDISKMERGKMLPTAPRLRRLAQALGISADFLLGLDDEDPEAEGVAA